jgi:hypothetical membrane protein
MAVNQSAVSIVEDRAVPTRALLLAGVAGPVAFVAVFLIVGALRPGYDSIRHFVSLLSIGEGGWVQVATFLLGGLSFIAFGIGLARVWRSAGIARWVPRLVMLAGGALVACGVFTADPALGYPPGTPAGIPTDISWHGGLHYLGAILVFVGLAAAMVIDARSGPRSTGRAWAAYSLVSAIVLLGGWIGGFLLVNPDGIVETAGLLQRIAIVAGWQWLAATAVIELRRGTAPNRSRGT